MIKYAGTFKYNQIDGCNYEVGSQNLRCYYFKETVFLCHLIMNENTQRKIFLLKFIKDYSSHCKLFLNFMNRK